MACAPSARVPEQGRHGPVLGRVCTGPCLCAPCFMAPRRSRAGTHSIIARCPSSVFFGIQPLFAVGSSQCEGRRPSRFSARSWVCLGPVWPKLVDMRLTAFTDVSLRLIMRLAVAREGELLTTRTVATMLAVPYTHMAKAVARMAEMGLVEARRGRGGGLLLTDEGRRVSVGAIVRELEGSGDLASCEGDPPCPLRSACRLRGALREAREAFYASLDAVTVASLADAPARETLVLLQESPFDGEQE